MTRPPDRIYMPFGVAERDVVTVRTRPFAKTDVCYVRQERHDALMLDLWHAREEVAVLRAMLEELTEEE